MNLLEFREKERIVNALKAYTDTNKVKVNKIIEYENYQDESVEEILGFFFNNSMEYPWRSCSMNTC